MSCAPNMTAAAAAADRNIMELMLREIISGEYLTGDHMDRFGRILESNTEFRPVSSFVIGAADPAMALLLSEPVRVPHIQLLFSGVQSHVQEVGHWIVVYHDGNRLYVYDSLNSGSLTPAQLNIVRLLFPNLPTEPTFMPVQQQLNMIDCGLFAVANATSLALGLDPCAQRYVLSEMRPHIATMLSTGTLLPFPSEDPSLEPQDIEMHSPSFKEVYQDDYPPLVPTRRPGRQKKKHVGRPKTSQLSKQEQIREAKKRYSITPEGRSVHQKAVAKYSQTHHEVNQEAVKRYKATNKNTIIETSKIERAVPKLLRKDSLIGSLTGDYFDKIEPHSLNPPGLNSPDVYCCNHCGAALFEEERGRVKWCCGQGAYHTNILPPISSSFYFNESFLKDARSYNNLFSFSAIGVSGGFQTFKSGVSFVKILGRTYHRVFDLSWQSGPNNCGMYIDDGEERMRLAAGRSLDGDVIHDITSYLNDVNPFIPTLRRLSTETSEQAHIVFEKTSRRTHGPVLGDVPLANEIAAVLNTEANKYSPREVVIWKVGDSKPHTVNVFHPSYECLQYPLLFPHGSEGWHIGMEDKNGKKLSQVKYYRHLLLSEPRFTRLRRLSQEYLVDMFCRMEEERLKFISNNQGSVLKIATREEIDETIVGEGGVQPGRIYLPASFTNSPRYMQVKYQDGMAIVHRLGKPTYFLTVTCNPKWKEIQHSLNAGERATDRPDLCDRVFQLKLQFLLKEIKSGKLFGTLSYILHVIEFQKRGLPHAHICFKINGDDPVESGQIDSFVKATIPPENEKKLRALVLEHMVHGPACTRRKDLPCVDPTTRQCTKHFPKSPVEVTHVDDKGFVQYKRSATNVSKIKRGNKEFEVCDCDIVPYNPALLLQLECHANIEIASTRKIVKYLFKYIHKGPDAVKVNIVSERFQETDEIEHYVTRRYIGASDAIWRLLEFDITGRHPSVIQLPVHLPNKDHVVYRPGQEQAALDRTVSKLTIYMGRPASDEFKNLTYCQFYENYIVDTKNKSAENAIRIDKYFVTPRKRGQMVARIYWISPALGELHYLRMLLQRFPCSSFENLRTVGDEMFSTFQDAARSVGLLNEEKEYYEALEEASRFMVGQGLRRFFLSWLLMEVRQLLFGKTSNISCAKIS